VAADLSALLDELELRLRAFGAPIAEAFRAGAAPGRVREALAAEGVTPHDDLVTWWGWHDGAAVDAQPMGSGPFIHRRSENLLVGGWHLLPLSEAVAIRRWFRETYTAATVERLFPQSWMPVLTTDGAGELCADTAAAGPAPLHIHDEGYLGGEPPHFASLAEFVTAAIDAFDRGLVGGAEDPRLPWIRDAALQTELRRLIIW
jgi:hypothetical protein